MQSPYSYERAPTFPIPTGNNYRLRANDGRKPTNQESKEIKELEKSSMHDTSELRSPSMLRMKDLLSSDTHYMECLCMRVIASGLDHPHTWQMINSLALVLNNMGRTYDELKLYKDMYDIYHELLGKKHCYTISMQNNLGHLMMVLSKTRDYRTEEMRVQQRKVRGR